MLLIKNGRVMDPKTGFDQITDLLVAGKKIVKIGQDLQAEDAKVIDADWESEVGAGEGAVGGDGGRRNQYPVTDNTATSICSAVCLTG